MKFPFSKINFILMGVAFAVIVLGFVLMYGSSTEVAFNPDVFSFRRVTVAPIVCMLGFVLMIVAIMWKPKNRNK
jgi:NADH:ubiquinone oxidoreductase subunit 2 (subunit N)